MDSSSSLTSGSRRFQIVVLAFTTVIVLTALVGVSALSGGGTSGAVGGAPEVNSSIDDRPASEQGELPEGQLPEGQLPEGELPEGEAPEGQVQEGQVQEGQSSPTQTKDSRPASGTSSNTGDTRASDTTSGAESGGENSSDGSIFSRIAGALTQLTGGETNGGAVPSDAQSTPTEDTGTTSGQSGTQATDRGGQQADEETSLPSGSGKSNPTGKTLDWLSNVSVGDSPAETPETLKGEQSNQVLESANTTAQERQSSPDSLDTFTPEPHFESGSNQQGNANNETYWRTTAFESYNTTGVWSQRPSNASKTLPEVGETDGIQTGESPGRVENITLRQNASVVPSSANTQAVSIKSGANPDDYEFVKQPDGTVTTTDGDGTLKPLPDGTTIQTQSQAGSGAGNTDIPTPTATETEANRSTEGATSGQTLTQTPRDLNPKIGRVASEVTDSAGAETNSEKASAITDWVKQNNEYRPDTKVNDSEQPTSEFLLENQTGGTGDFATTTAMMMREEGVPARVATGYRSSNESQPQSETVGAMDQHMWVEAQNESGDWGQYDPTPTDKQSLQSTVANGNISAQERGVTEEVISSWRNGSANVTNSIQERFENAVKQAEDDDDSNGTPIYIVELEPDPKPGQTVTAEVYTEYLRPVSGATVLFNQDSVGKTGASGELTTTVPYVETLNVTVAGGKVADTTEETEVGGAASTRSVAVPDNPDGSEPVSDNQTDSALTSNTVIVEDGNKIYDLPTDVQVDQDGAVLPGDTVTASTTIDGEPTPGLEVTAGGRPVGETDRSGTITVSIPETASQNETIPIVATRGDVRAEGAITTSSLTMSVDGGIIPLPGQSATIHLETVTDGERTALSNTDITVMQQAKDGERDIIGATTTGDGEATITLLSANQIEITTRAGTTTTATSLSGLYMNVAAIIGIVVSIIGAGIGALIYRYDISRIKEILINGFFAITSTLLTACSAVWTATLNTWSALRHSVRRMYEYGSNAHPLRVLWQMITAPSILLTKMNAAMIWLYRLIVSLPQSLIEIGGQLNNPTNTLEKISGSGSDTDVTGPKALIRKYWRQIINRSIGRETIRTKTTVEIESRIVNAGLPEQPVHRVRKSIQQIQYGNRAGADEITSVENAVDEINNQDATEQLDSPSD